MHANEQTIEETQVRQLLASQFPRWATLPLKPVGATGTDNILFRLGSKLVVRFPRVESAVAQRLKEHHWLPKLAPQLPLQVPQPLALGQPSAFFPWHWSIYAWIEGEPMDVERVAQNGSVAVALARFIQALQKQDTNGAPVPGEHNSWRGVALVKRDRATRRALTLLENIIDTKAALQTWEAAVDASPHQQPPVWLHGDLMPSNLLMKNGRLIGVIDFGCLGVGDPACDVMAAWTLFDKSNRRTFREALAVDHATWLRGCGWALSFGLIALPYYQNTNPTLARIAKRTIDQTLLDFS